MSKGHAFLVLVVILVIINLVLGNNILANFFLGMVSVVISYFSIEYFESDIVKSATAIGLTILFAPFALYLFWFALIGAYSVSPEVASNWLSNYWTDYFVQSLPSTIAAAIGTSMIESFRAAL